MTDEQREPVTELEAIAAAVRYPLADLAGAFFGAITNWYERNRAVLETLVKLAEDPGIRAYLAERESREQPCHCLCGKLHPAEIGICDMGAVTARHFDSPAIGPVDVPLCAPCAAAQGIARELRADCA